MLIDYIVEIGLNAVKKKSMDVRTQNQIKSALRKYIEVQRHYNESCTGDEEIDFGGISMYICNQFMDDIENRIFGQTKEIRGRAHMKIVSESLLYAKENTRLSEERVKHFVSDALSIIRDFYYKKLSKELKVVITTIVEDIAAVGADQHSEQTQILTNAIHELKQEIHNESLLSMETNIGLIKAGKIDSVGERLTSFIQAMSSQHVLYPCYGFEPRKIGRKIDLVSIPLTSEALRLYPPRIECDGRISIAGKSITHLTPQTFEYARNHQLPITLTAERARKLLGNIEDPQQCEAEELLGIDIILPPKPFPEAMAYSIVVNEDILYEYILLRTQEILDDGTVVFSNDEQRIPLCICLKVNPTIKEATFTFKLNGGSTSDLLCYRQFLRKAEQGAHIVIHHLESGRNLFEGTINLKSNHNERTASFDDEIDFLRKVIAIEEYFHVNIDIPEQILGDDVEAINYISAIIQGLEVSGGWLKYELNLTIGGETKEKILSCIDTPCGLTYMGSVTVSVFGKNYTFPCQRTLSSVVLMDADKIRKKLDVLDNGDSIKLIYLPGANGEKGVYVDQLPLNNG